MKKSQIKYKVSYTIVTNDLVNNPHLNAAEKMIYIVLKSLENAPYGIRPSHRYIMQRTGIKTRQTLIRHLDRLAQFGLVGFRQPKKNEPNEYSFDPPKIQEFIKHNKNKRNKIKYGLKEVRTIKQLKGCGKVIKFNRGDV